MPEVRTTLVIALFAAVLVACESATGPSADPDPVGQQPIDAPSDPPPDDPPPDDPPADNITIRVSGRVAAAATGSPISGARVSVRPDLFPPLPEIAGAFTDDDGRYTLQFTVFGSCIEDLYEISASSAGFRTETYQKGTGDPRLRCKAGLQTIDFSLERNP